MRPLQARLMPQAQTVEVHMIADRQARQERAQAAALKDLEIKADHQREQTNKLRKLRLEREKAMASRFKSWREQKPSNSES